jgi:hypothetical protein
MPMRLILAAVVAMAAEHAAAAPTHEPWAIMAGYQLVVFAPFDGPIFSVLEPLAPFEPPAPLAEPWGPIAEPWAPILLTPTPLDAPNMPTPPAPGYSGPTLLAPIVHAPLGAPAAVPVPAAGPLLAAALLAGWLGARRRRG